MSNPILKYFEYGHLPPKLLEVSAPLCELARKMNAELPDCAEKSAGLRKLLEAKDCFVRAALEKSEAELVKPAPSSICPTCKQDKPGGLCPPEAVLRIRSEAGQGCPAWEPKA